MRKLLVITLLALAANAYAVCEDKFPFGKPVVKGNFTELCRKGYANFYNNEKKIPFVVYEHLTPTTIGRGQSERGSFHVDTDISPQYRSSPKDYSRTGSKFDKGHLANAQNAENDEAMRDTMLMSNIVPQVGSFNRGSWKTLETHIAKSVRRGRDLYVITGALVSTSGEKIGSGVAVPTHLFKIVIDKNDVSAIAFLMPNETNNESYKNFEINIAQLMILIGTDLIPELKGLQRLILFKHTDLVLK